MKMIGAYEILLADVLIVLLIIFLVYKEMRKKRKKNRGLVLPLYPKHENEDKTFYRCPKCKAIFEKPAKEILWLHNPKKERPICPNCFTPFEELLKMVKENAENKREQQ